MKEINNYFKGSTGQEENIDRLKYGLLNDRGYDFSTSKKVKYNEEYLIKTKCNLKNY